MSLNGLDDVKVAEAYQGALAEAGGWFLLKYVSRDAVEVLTRGSGGAAEARGAVAQYEEKSPLYGFLLYRRRKVMIKYIPEGTSRLLQARVAVHFQAVTEKFTPHDTTISITSADELSDAALISACSLHTAAPSSCSSSGSSRRNKLDEITEDVEEGQGVSDEAVITARPATAASSIPTILEPVGDESTAETETQADPSALGTSGTSTSLDELKRAQEPKLNLSHVTVGTISEKKETELNAADYRESLKHYDALFENGPDPRASSQTARPELSDLYAEIYAQYKPKVKLGPRPRPSLDSKRPHTSGNGAQSPARPVSSLPAGLRVANRKTIEPKRPKSRDSSVVPSIAFPPPPPVPSIPEMPIPSPTYPPKSPASVRSMPIPGYDRRSSGVTPEKQRLMKALELRKKQLKAQKEREAKELEALSQETSLGADESEAKETAQPADTEHVEVLKEEASPVEAPEHEPATASKEEHETLSKPEETTTPDAHSATPPEDLSEDMTSSQAETDDQHSAASACSPTSAQTQGSSVAPSTRPSSISEDDRGVCETSENLEGGEALADQKSEATVEASQNEDGGESVESTPTVVPENDSPVPTVEIVSEPSSDAQPPASHDEFLTRKKNRESMIFMSHSDQGDSRSQRSKRESMVFFPSNGQAPDTEIRDPAILAAPKRKSFIEVKEKRRAAVEPIQIHLSAENSDAEYLSDDSFMEELQSATVQEAKPISVSKSPITPYFPRNSTISEVTIPERSSSAQYKPGSLTPERLGERRTSRPWPPPQNTDTVVTAKKINVSSGISQRIRALAEKSSRDSVSVSPATTPEASHSLVAQRKTSFFSTPPSGNSPTPLPSKRFSRASFATLSNSSTPDKKPVLQPSPPPPSTEQPIYHTQRETVKPESVQVTARIVRDARVHKPSLTMPTENTPLELHQSPIIIDHQKSALPAPRPKSSAPKAEPTSPLPPSSSHSRDPSAALSLPRSSSESSWRSFGRRMSESKPSAAARSQSVHSIESADEKKEEKKEKKDSRTTKLFKRMSTLSRKNGGISPTLTEEDYPPTSLPSLREPPPPVQVGDLNVQFPDTLLWKRRWVEIDAMGNLVLSLSKANEQSKGIVKRFHLNEFRTPYAPDQDRQELPNSVVLDFVDGRTLQCACETYVAQVQVLQILREAHEAWLAYGQLH